MNQADAALVASTSIAGGVELEGSGMVSLTGMDEFVRELINDNISTAFDGEVPVNASGCYHVCFGMGATFDRDNPTMINSVSWSFGGGEGGEIGVDAATAQTWLAYGSNSPSGGYVIRNKSPLNLKEMFGEAWKDFRHDFEKYYKEWKSL